MADSTLQFKFSEDDITLEAIYDVAASKDTIVDSKWVKKQLAEDGFDNLYVLQDELLQLVDILNNADPGPGRIKIAQKRDAQIEISLSRDKMSAHMTIHPPLGGKAASLDMIKQALAEKSIRNGFISQAIKVAILNGKADNVLIAAGEPIINGEDSKFICLLPEVKIRTPHVAENGNVDYRDLGEIMIVHAGEKLMRREPSTPGKPSKNVLGEVVNPKRGKDIPYAKGLDGVELSKQDPNILVATNTGQPIIEKHGVSVEDTMVLPVVNLASGNIIFDGSVIIQGDVENSMKVKASGDINVTGMVESAELEAGGDIVISGAIIGRGDVRDSKDRLNSETAIIKAEGSISAKFTENAYLEAKNNIFIQDWVLKSEISALNEIIVGNKNAKKGQIIGGKVTSGILVKAINMGSSAGALTQINVGSAVNVDTELENINKELTSHSKALKDMQKAISSLKNNPTRQAQEMLKKTLLTRKSIEEKMAILATEKSRLKTEQVRVQNAKLTVDKTIYAGVQITIGGISKTIDEDLGRRSFAIEEGKLIQKIE